MDAIDRKAQRIDLVPAKHYVWPTAADCAGSFELQVRQPDASRLSGVSDSSAVLLGGDVTEEDRLLVVYLMVSSRKGSAVVLLTYR